MAKNSNVPRGTIIAERLRPIKGTAKTAVLNIDNLKNFRLFAVAYGVVDRPNATAIFSIHEQPKEARLTVRGLKRKGFLAEVLTLAIPAFYFNLNDTKSVCI